MSLLSAPAHPPRARSPVAPGGFVPHERLANTGGPMSRTRSERIASTLLGRDDGAIRCPRSLRLGLAFPRRADPVKTIETLLRSNGYGSAEDLRDEFALPAGRLICRPLEPNAPRLAVRDGPEREVLEQALLLGPVHRAALRRRAPGALDPGEPDAGPGALRSGGVLRMNAERFRSLLDELIDENPFAIRAVLKVLDVCFTESVPTLAVTCEERPRLLVNLTSCPGTAAPTPK